MPERFSNPEVSIDALPNYETVHFNGISKKQLTKSWLQISIFVVVFVIAAAVYYYFRPFDLLSAIVVGLLVLFFVFRYVDCFLKQRYYGYALREKDILYRRGYLVNRVTVIPFNRIQHASVSRSLLDKLFGLASLNIYTAGGSGSDIGIPGLSPDLARNLNDRLSQKISEDDS